MVTMAAATPAPWSGRSSPGEKPVLAHVLSRVQTPQQRPLWRVKEIEHRIQPCQIQAFFAKSVQAHEFSVARRRSESVTFGVTRSRVAHLPPKAHLHFEALHIGLRVAYEPFSEDYGFYNPNIESSMNEFLNSLP
jgi:hypothetical protein